jgi:hypothetical protein
MGVVWRAHDELLDREVAVKQLRLPDLTPEEAATARARAMREARNAARLHHPGAIAVFDVVVEDDRPWLVMEHLPSRSLANLLAERGRLEPGEAARIGGQVAAALAAAHAAGIVHRDVKPSNVLIGHDGTVKLTDFGISRAAGDGTLTDSGMITGTPAYLAPEVARGEQPGSASDVFSLGATLYAATEGRSPYGTSDNSFGLLYRAAAGRIEPPTGSGPLTDLLSRLLDTDPAARPTAEEAVELLAEPRRERERPAALEGADEPGERPSGAGEAGGARESAEPGEPGEPEGPGSGNRPRPGWLAPLVAAVVLLVGAVSVTAMSLLPDAPDAPGGEHVAAWSSAPPAFTTDDAVALVQGHYDLLPENLEVAYDNLTPTYSQSFEEYRAFWGQYDDVRAVLVDVRDEGSRTWARVAVTFVRGGVESTGNYLLRVEPYDGRLRIVAAEELPGPSAG